MTELTPNSISLMLSGNTDMHPILQVLDVKQIGSTASAQERYRLVITDGTVQQQAMLATQLNDIVKDSSVVMGSIIQLKEYICNTVQNRRIIIILNMEIVVARSPIIGNGQVASASPSGGILQSHGQTAAPVQDRMSSQQHMPPPTSAPYGYSGPSPVSVPGAPSSSYGSLADKPFVYRPTAEQTTASEPPGQRNGGSLYGRSSNGPLGGDPVGIAGNGQGANMGMPFSVRPGNVQGRQGLASSYEPPPIYSNRGPIARNDAPARIIPIAALNPYQGRWTIKARVTAKQPMKRYNNARGEGKVFSFDLLDAAGGEIRATCFTQVADQFYDRVQVGEVYVISKGSLKTVQRKEYNHLKNEWELYLETASTVERVVDDNTIPKQQYDFKSIDEIESMPNNTMVDVLGIVHAVNPTGSIMRKTGVETAKRTLLIRDRSGKSVEITLWGEYCNREGEALQQLCDAGECPILAVKGGRVSDFSGKSVGTISTSQLVINPDHVAANALKAWYETEGRNAAVYSISRDGIGAGGGRMDVRKTVAAIKDEGLGRSEKADWISVRGVISFIKMENFCYAACPNMAGDRTCNKKVTNNADGKWYCEKCGISMDKCDYRYILSLQIQDHTGTTWLTAFSEAGEEIMGVSAGELYEWKSNGDPRFGEAFANKLFTQRLFKLKVKEESWQEETRLKSTVVKADKLDFATESAVLQDYISKLQRGEPLSSGPPPAPPSMPAAGGTYMSGGTSYGGTAGGAGGGYGGGGGFGNAYGGGGGGGGGDVAGNGSACYKCGQGGHWARDCPGAAAGGRSGGGDVFGARGNGCFKCNQPGHFAKDCPNAGGGRF